MFEVDASSTEVPRRDCVVLGAMDPVAVVAALLNLAVHVALIVVARRASNRWRVLDLATRAAPHGSPQQQAKLALCAAALDLGEMEGLSQLILATAMKQYQRL
jgi:hypothetical protein